MTYPDRAQEWAAILRGDAMDVRQKKASGIPALTSKQALELAHVLHECVRMATGRYSVDDEQDGGATLNWHATLGLQEANRRCKCNEHCRDCQRRDELIAVHQKYQRW